MIVLLAAQVVFLSFFARFVIFRVLGSDYDAAVITAGVCGFGMGATPNAMANMKAVCDKYAPSFKAFMLVPIVGSLFADFSNSIIITAFVNFIG
jgi:ESS family glutamate:Na+ symporter